MSNLNVNPCGHSKSICGCDQPPAKKMDKIDGYLSTRVQSVWPDSLVLCVDDHAWIVRRPDVADVGLGDNFSAAQQAISALLRAERAKSK